MPKKVRVDVLMVERGLAESRSQAQRLVMAGQVRADGQVVLKPSATLQAGASLEVDEGPPYVSRGGEKLEFALRAFSVEVGGQVCADVGASTGGFTDCLLQHGAARVYAVDVGKGILHWRLRRDPLVVVMERTNARYLELLPEPVSLVTIDASFISLKLLLGVVSGWFAGSQPELLDAAGQEIGSEYVHKGTVIALVKPQFEAGRKQVAKGDGVIRDPLLHRDVLLEVLGFAQEAGYRLAGLVRSPLVGPKGNVEFLAVLDYPGAPRDELEALVDSVTEGRRADDPEL
jgi:23S rRNA (cytidine1920-2'-O)/16S rRNA (cytidine1409-2'-O)-methyltransferase